MDPVKGKVTDSGGILLRGLLSCPPVIFGLGNTNLTNGWEQQVIIFIYVVVCLCVFNGFTLEQIFCGSFFQTLTC